MTDYRFPTPGTDAWFPSPGVDERHKDYPADRRFYAPGEDYRFEGVVPPADGAAYTDHWIAEDIPDEGLPWVGRGGGGVLDVVSGATHTGVDMERDPVTGRRTYRSKGGANCWARLPGSVASAQPNSFSMVLYVEDTADPTASLVYVDSADTGNRNMIWSGPAPEDSWAIWANVAGMVITQSVLPGDWVGIVARFDGANSRLVVRGRQTNLEAVTGNPGPMGTNGLSLFAWSGAVLNDSGISGNCAELVWAKGTGWTDAQMDVEIARLANDWRLYG